MDLTQLANLGEFIGGIAVLATLIYLAVQVRQNTNTLAANRHQDALRMANSNYAPFIENREFADFIRTARDTPERLDETDWERFVHFAYQSFAVWESAYLNYRDGLIGEDLWQAWDRVGRRLWSGAGYQRFWDQEGAGHATAFQEYVDSHVFAPEARS